MSKMQVKLRALIGLFVLMSAGITHANKVTYVYTDPQGTPLAEADASGNITATFDYASYGSQALGSPPDEPGYTGHVNDPDTGLVYMQARYYDPAVGRFLSTDPVTPAAGNLFDFNRYDYANNNPVNNADPNGKSTVYACPGGIVIVVQTFNNQTIGKTNIPINNSSIEAQGSKFSGETNGHYMSIVLRPGTDSDSVQIKVDSSLHDHEVGGVPSAHRSNSDLGGREIRLAPDAVGPITVGHELGHSMHAGDLYQNGIGADGKPVTQDVLGTKGTIMRDYGGLSAALQTRNEIYKGLSDPNNIQKACHVSAFTTECN